MERLITVVGPTAVGKTALTLALAAHYHSPVISGDAYQVYRGLTIGTAKPSRRELATVPHYLIDILNPTESYNVSAFQEQCKRIITECNRRGQIPILSGGTGLYVQSLLENYRFTKVPPDKLLRAKLDALYETEGMNGLRQYANRLAQKGNISLAVTDKHRLYRVIEMMEAGDYDTLRVQRKDGLVYDGAVIGLMRSRDDLYKRINTRVDLMFEAGLVQEVERLVACGADPGCQAFKGIGYKEVVEYLTGALTLNECRELIKKNTRRFAKRQITWYKQMPYIRWIYIDEMTDDSRVFDRAMEVIQEYKY